MTVFDGNVYHSLAESRWAMPQTNVAILSMLTPSTDNTVGSKRKLPDDAVVEVEKRHCRNYFALIRPIRIIKTPTGPQAYDIPALLLPRTVKTKGKRLCPPTFNIPSSKAICRSLQHSRPIRKMIVPLLARRSSYIFPSTSKAKREYAEEPDISAPKRLHKELDNQALCMHFASHDRDYQPTPRIHLGPNKGSRHPFSQIKPDASCLQANSRRHTITLQPAQPVIDCMDIDTNQDQRPRNQPTKSISDSMEIEVYQDPRPLHPDPLHPIASLGPDEHDEPSSEIQHSRVENRPNQESSQAKDYPLPQVRRRRRFAHIKGTSNRIRGDIETLTIDGDAMAGLIWYPMTESGIFGWLSSALATPKFTGRDALSYFRRLIYNFIDRPPQPYRYDPCSAWGLLSA